MIARWLPLGGAPAAAADGPDRPSATIRADARPGSPTTSAAASRSCRSCAAGTTSFPGGSRRSSRPPPPATRDELRRVAHTLRGATEIFGGAQVAGACAALELAAADDLTGHAEALVEVVERACAEARAAMLAWLDAA